MFNRFNHRIVSVLAAASIAALTGQSAYAAPGLLPPAPLFLSTIVEPNVFITLDDSGSMDWGLMVKSGLGEVVDGTGTVLIPGFTTHNGLPYIDGLRRGYYAPGEPKLYTTRYYLPPADGTDPDWDKAWIVRNHNGNANYYNPSIRYAPWPGTLANGDPMYESISDPTKTPFDPDDFDPSNSSHYIDLTAKHTFSEGGLSSTVYVPTYWTWEDGIKIPIDGSGNLIDSNGDNILDSDDGVAATPNGIIEFDDGRRRVQITDATELENFANWFAYYRSRINVTKAVLGGVINKTDASRMGIRLFNQSSNLANVATMSDAANKRDLLDGLYEHNIVQAGTPARSALDAVGDYFKLKTTSSPILPEVEGGECQQNFNILMSDGFYNSNSAPNIGNTDESNGGSPSIFDGDASQSNDGGNYADSYSNTLADGAMLLYETDLRDDLDDLVPTLVGVDEADHQHLVTFTVAFGISGTLDPTTIDPLAAGFTWPKPVLNTETTVDDMWHAAYNARGDFLSAQDPQELERSLSTAINTISARTGTAAAVAVNSAQLSLESVIYLAQFNSNRWQGNLIAYQIADTDTGELKATPNWDVASKLNARDLSTKARTIMTYSNDPGVKDGVAFNWASISSDMQDDLKTSAIGGVDPDSTAEARLNYLRGDRSNEGVGLQFRQRLSRLGDMVNSGPVFVGPPGLGWPDFAPFPVGTDAYSEFKNGAASSRDNIVYIGANDGMLHAFSAPPFQDDDSDGNDDSGGGEEVFAYVPGLFASTAADDGLHYLTEGNYAHKFYVDLTPAISDVFISSGSSTEWHTVLINGLRSGGRGLFALNITDPNLFKESEADKVVMWEFSSDDDADLGYTFSQPFIALTNSGKWVAIFGNGYNDLGSGEASLFIVDIEAGVDGNWTPGDYIKISTGVGDPGDPNGLATPALADIDGNGTVDRVYAGDLRGNMWAFDLSSTNASQWKSAYGSVATPLPFFTTPPNQPITAKPVLAKHPTQPNSSSPSNAPNLMVYFGTGQYLVDADKKITPPPPTQSFYGVWDQGDDSLTNGDLVEQTFDGTFSVRVLSRNPVDYSTDWGWYFDLPTTGERSVTAPIARSDTVFFNSFVPVDDPCSIGGFGFRFAVDMVTGGSPQEPSFDLNGDGVIDDSDYVSNGIENTTQVAIRQEGFLPEPVFIEDLAFTAEEAIKVKALKDIPVGRFSWQELIQ